MRPHRWQPNRLPCPWDSPGKNTGVGCHFLLQCLKVKSEREVAQSCLTPSNPMDCSPPGSSIHGIFQARVLEWGAIAFSKILPLGGSYFHNIMMLIKLPRWSVNPWGIAYLYQKGFIVNLLSFAYWEWYHPEFSPRDTTAPSQNLPVTLSAMPLLTYWLQFGQLHL